MRNKLLLAAFFILAVVADQASKIVVDSVFALYESRPMLGNILRLYYIRNTGAAFGLRIGNPSVMLWVTVLVTLFLVYLFVTGRLDGGSLLGKAALVLVLAGAVGNLIDRVRLGEVIDFIDMGIGPHRWPTYNLADVFVTCGMLVLIVSQFFQPRKAE
ncbi:MAG: signal peptidase II [Candidatus Latescibacteria bacterium]|nr:signal peptidase II [Candidatus Latescibacterota bacterium]